MKYTFTLLTQAFSVNAYRYRKNFVKTAEAREYEEKILYMLEEHKGLRELAEDFKGGDEIHVKLTFTYPKHVFHNQAGHVSSKTFDLSNVEKPLLDLIINNYMNLDDRHVTKLTSEKRIGSNYTIEVTLEIQPKA